MRFDDDSIFGMAGDDDDLMLPATIAPSPDDMFETITLMHLEAGRITQDDLPDLSWDNLPAMPETMSDQDRALWLAFQAYSICLEDPETAAEMAETAMEIDAACVDAFVARWFMMDIESEEALIMAAKAAFYGHQLIEGTKEIREFSDIWKYPRIRGAVRAFAALALTNWAHGNRHDAIESAEHVLKLTPHDEVGITPYLANWYLATGQTKRANRLLREYEDEGMASIEYARALVAFVREGPEEARAALLSAAEAHPLILGFMALSARDDLISPTEEYPFHDYQPGTIEETAVWYTLIEDTWQSVEGAFEWAIRCCNEPEFEKLVGAAAMEAAIELEGLIGPLNDIDVDDLLGDLFPDDEDESDDPGLRLI